MTTFDDRKQAFENRFAHDAELQFKVAARRNKLLGAWVAGKLGMTGEAAVDYAKSVVIADLAEAGDADVVAKVLADFAAHNVAITEAALRAEIERLGPIARDAVMNELD